MHTLIWRAYCFQVKKKAEILKGNRDYSFLFSDDADAPNEPSAKNCSQSKSGKFGFLCPESSLSSHFVNFSAVCRNVSNGHDRYASNVLWWVKSWSGQFCSWIDSGHALGSWVVQNLSLGSV